jgi:hypothetical protein
MESSHKTSNGHHSLEKTHQKYYYIHGSIFGKMSSHTTSLQVSQKIPKCSTIESKLWSWKPQNEFESNSEKQNISNVYFKWLTTRFSAEY